MGGYVLKKLQDKNENVEFLVDLEEYLESRSSD